MIGISFDAVWASASLIHLPYEDAAVALGEFARVTRTGAPISVSVKSGGVTGWADDMPIGRRWFPLARGGQGMFLRDIRFLTVHAEHVS